jgi:co-chaperonin GroES (HSP10)
MKVLHDNVLLVEDDQKETTTTAGIILSSEITTGNKPARVIAMGLEVANKQEIAAGDKVYCNWSEAMPVEIDGTKMAVIKYEFIRLKVDS